MPSGRSVLLRGRRPPLAAGLPAAVALTAICTGVIYPLAQLTAVASLGVVYLVGVVIVSAFWGLALGLLTSLLSAAAFNFFHLPPVGQFTISDNRDWVALAAFFVAAVVTSTVSERARLRAVEAESRRAEADLTAEMAQLLLARVGVEEALALIGRRLALVFKLPSATIALTPPDGDARRPATDGDARRPATDGDARRPATDGDGRRQAIPLRAGETELGTLLVPADLPTRVVDRLRERVVPALAAMLGVALERERLVAETVETEGLRRSEAVKTAVLRAVSHDLRSPVTAMVAAGSAVRAPELTADEREELGRLVVDEGARLARLIDDLLDLSKLEAHQANPRVMECSVEEVIDAALAAQPREADFDVRIDVSTPPIWGDFVQVERVLANLMENAARYADGEAVIIRARAVGDKAIVRVIDRGPGIPAADQARIFEPFYRSPGGAGAAHPGSGLGLAIAKGFVEANGGRIWVESTPGRGSAFVLELPTASASPR